MLKNIFILFFYCNSSILIAQQLDSINFKNGIDNPSNLATHHFGIFSSRINTNFKQHPYLQPSIEFTAVSGNNFHPYLEAYIPLDPEVRAEQKKLIWYNRNFNFVNQETTPADYLNIVIDAVIKEFRLDVSFPLAKKHELNFTLRSYLFTKGKFPFSIFTGDEYLEWFHSNIAGGQDPYGRRYYGLNQVNFKYTDRNGNVLELHQNDAVFGGLEINHFYYPTFAINRTKNIYFNFGSHLGINTTQFNSSLDLGLSANALKQISFTKPYQLNIGIGMNVLRKNVINFKESIDFGSNPFLATIETDIEITKFTKNKNYSSFTINYQIQSRYNQREESNFYKLIGKWEEINGGWQHGISTLYNALSYWTFIYTYARPNYKIALYAKEDFRVNNAPDFQTGISLKIPIFKK